ncbi:hypothetical protein BDN72DRAFT_966195 [Pluteus cervinus]|uniref:Uncharacterized protein n=1 Tax=Pluteus cervinus TaxID=181527 RepID=A0ACD3A000_9AGAR|nr:hypothetical protein BDN72DRAFT_966195 [Pluteus cervinus]
MNSVGSITLQGGAAGGNIAGTAGPPGARNAEGEGASQSCGDLRDDVTSALAKFDFDGTFAVADRFPQAPNPVLTIEGIGAIGLPLSEREAKAIIGASAQAPYGHGEETVVNTEVRNTWEIEPTKILFQNPAWKAFIQHTVVPHVWSSLGVAKACTPPRCELYKLLLYETGSHFLPHQDTQKSPGMFATVVVLLPSAYTGGQVQVSHSGETRTFDLSQNSMLNTGVLAWYTDVTHSVLPLRSGYRLALSYNLIHTSPNVPIPSLPTTDEAVIRLRRILENWKDERYQKGGDSKINLLAYLLGHQYSGIELGEQDNPFKGRDAQVVANLRPLAEELALTTMALKDYNLVPKNPFKGVDPDESEYEGYMGNGAGSLEHWYRRTVLILLHEDNAHEPLFLKDGLQEVVSPLQRMDPSNVSEDERAIARLAYKKLDPTKPNGFNLISEIILNWKDFPLWKGLCAHTGYRTEIVGIQQYFKALQLFTLEELRPILENALSKTQSLADRLSLVQGIPTSGDPAIAAWCQAEKLKALENIGTATPAAAPVLIELAKAEGISKIMEIILPQLQQRSSIFKFWKAFIEALYAARPTEPNESELAKVWQEAIQTSLTVALSQWTTENAKPRIGARTNGQQSMHQPAPHVDLRIQTGAEMIDLCLAINSSSSCSIILDQLLSTGGTTAGKFNTLFTPFAPQLVDTLAKHDISIASPPFSVFARRLVGLHLRDLLGPMGPRVMQTQLQVNCHQGCLDCSSLNRFLASTEAKFQFKAIDFDDPWNFSLCSGGSKAA